MNGKRIATQASAEHVDGATWTTSDLSKKRRVGVSIACESCRRKKIRCDGGRPTCTSCCGGPEQCTYRSERPLSEDTIQLIRDLVRLIHGISEQERSHILSTLKVETDADNIFALVREGLTIEQSPKTDSLPFLIPALPAAASLPSKAVLLFGSENIYPIAYPSFESIEAESGASRAAIRQLMTSMGGNNPDHGMTDEQSEASLNDPRGKEHGTTGYILCDDRLRNVDISRWTTVEISNEQAARSISLYMQTDHPLLGHFDPDLFISDLIKGRHGYCSSMMVNAMMYWTCQMYSSLDKDISRYVDQFREEAERLWIMERENDSILNLAAAEFMSMSYFGQGKDHATLRYYNEAAAMGSRMRLFLTDRSQDQHHFNLLSSQDQVAYCYASWGIFNWQVFMSLLYHQPGMKSPPCIPTFPIPESHQEASEERSPSKIKLSFDKQLQFSIPDYMGQTFSHVCRFWECLYDFADMYYDRENGTLKEVPIYYAEYKFRQLMAWSNRLPPHMCRGGNNPHHVVVLHTWFHAIVLDIFRPFLQNPCLATKRLETFESSATTPQAVYLSSVKQLRRLVAVYRLKYSAANYSILWHSALIYVANAVLHNKSTKPGWLFDFLLCIRGYQNMRASWRVTDSITVALLSLAMHNRGLSSTTARNIVQDMRTNQTDRAATGDQIRAPFMGDLYSALTRPEVSSIEHLVELFDDNALTSDYTHLFDEDGIVSDVVGNKDLE